MSSFVNAAIDSQYSWRRQMKNVAVSVAFISSSPLLFLPPLLPLSFLFPLPLSPPSTSTLPSSAPSFPLSTSPLPFPSPSSSSPPSSPPPSSTATAANFFVSDVQRLRSFDADNCVTVRRLHFRFAPSPHSTPPSLSSSPSSFSSFPFPLSSFCFCFSFLLLPPPPPPLLLFSPSSSSSLSIPLWILSGGKLSLQHRRVLYLRKCWQRADGIYVIMSSSSK